MADRFGSKPGEDQGFDPRNNQQQPLAGTRSDKGVRRGQYEPSIPHSADLAVWEDEYNFTPQLANVTPRDGVDCTTHALFTGKGVSVDNVEEETYVYKPGRS